MDKIRLDMHVHTNFSDGVMDIRTLRKLSAKRGITPVITDHNTMEGAKKYGPIIMGEEIKTDVGEIMGYFMNETIPAGLGLHEAVDWLREQDALVIIPHPFDRIRRAGLRDKAIREIVSRVDGIEVFNGRCLMDSFNTKARMLAVNRNLLWTAGSDAHYPGELGKTYIEMYPFHSKKEFLYNLKEARRDGCFHNHKSSLLKLVSTKIATMLK